MKRGLIIGCMALVIISLAATGENNIKTEEENILDDGGGGGSGDTYTLSNNTIVIDNTSTAPIRGGGFVHGEIANIPITNLTTNTTYTLVDAAGNEIGDLTALDKEIRYYHVDITNYGEWSLFRANELDLEGLLADPVETFEIRESLGDEQDGSTAEQIPTEDTPATTDNVVQPCSYVVGENGRAKRDSTYENHTVHINGTEWVKATLNWTVKGSHPQSALSEFYMRAGSETSEAMGDPFRSPAAGLENETGQGQITTYVNLDEDVPRYGVHCKGHGPDETEQTLIRSPDDSYIKPE